MYELKIDRDPFDTEVKIYSTDLINIEEGLTVLVGCNGYGKTTLLNCIESSLIENKIPYCSYNNLVDGKKSKLDEAVRTGNMRFAADLALSSEGESISLSIGDLMYNMGTFLRTGKTKNTNTIFNDSVEIKSNKRFILLDAVDSGYSIDNIVDLKHVFNLMLEDSEKFGVETYIIVSANEYELARESNCMDVSTGCYLEFPTYDSYRDFIIESRSKKDKRGSRMSKEDKL